jgi:predicted dehydrogenase
MLSSKSARDKLQRVNAYSMTSSFCSLMINLVHEVDALQYLLGPIVPVSVEKMDGNGDGGEGEENTDAVETGAAFMLRFLSAVVELLSCPMLSCLPHSSKIERARTRCCLEWSDHCYSNSPMPLRKRLTW